MSTWHLFSDADHNFRWEKAGRTIPTKPKPENLNGVPNQPHNAVTPLPSMTDLLSHGCSKFLENGNELTENIPMFKTGLGKSVPLKKSSVDKALYLLRDDDDFRLPGKGDPIENGCNVGNSLFQKASGKTVNISAAGLVRAKTLLGLEQENDHCSSKGLKHAKITCIPKDPCVWGNLSHLEVKEDVKCNDFANVKSVPQPSSIFNVDLAGSKMKNGISSETVESQMLTMAPKPPPVTFHTAGGRSLSVSSAALQHARSLLGDPELETLFNDGETGELDLSFLKEGRFDDSSSNKKNDVLASFSNQQVSEITKSPKSFTSPLRSSSKTVKSVVKLKNSTMTCNLIKKFDAVDQDRGIDGRVPSVQKPLSNMVGNPNSIMDNASEDSIGLRINSHVRSSGKPLADITNQTGTSYSNVKLSSCEKRRLLRSSISPFKRPRSSKFSTPFNKNTSVANGLYSSPSKSSVCKRTVSSRYRSQKQRLYMKEFFGMPPSTLGMLDSLPAKVRWMTSETAEEYAFRNESGLNFIGVETFSHMLAKSGASVQYATKE